MIGPLDYSDFIFGRKNGIVYYSDAENINNLLKEGKVDLAGEYAIACIQTAVSLKHNSDNDMIKMILNNTIGSLRGMYEKYEEKAIFKYNEKIHKDHLEDIAKMYWSDHIKQIDIAKILSTKYNERISAQIINYRINNILKHYPEIIQKYKVGVGNE